jgi:hypothetical protein
MPAPRSDAAAATVGSTTYLDDLFQGV